MVINFTTFVSNLQKNCPKLQIKFKDQSLLMKILGKILFFNPRFTTDFITTIGYTVYFPTEKELDNQPDAISVLAHEYRHMRDLQQLNILFYILYAFPQWLILVAWPLVFLSIPLAVIVCLFLLLPLPAPGRSWLELKGYQISLMMEDYWNQQKGMSLVERKRHLTALIPNVNQYFTSSDYYFMWIFGVEDQLYQTVDDILSGKIYQDPICQEIKLALSSGE